MSRTFPSGLLRSGLAMLLLAAPGLAAPGRPGGRGPSHGPDFGPPPPPPPLARVLERHADELGLDAATLERIGELDGGGREASESAREAVREAREKLHALMGEARPDEAAAIAQVERLGLLETALHVERVRTDLRIRALLTEEQLETLRSLRPRR